MKAFYEFICRKLSGRKRAIYTVTLDILPLMHIPYVDIKNKSFKSRTDYHQGSLQQQQIILYHFLFWEGLQHRVLLNIISWHIVYFWHTTSSLHLALLFTPSKFYEFLVAPRNSLRHSLLLIHQFTQYIMSSINSASWLRYISIPHILINSPAIHTPVSFFLS